MYIYMRLCLFTYTYDHLNEVFFFCLNDTTIKIMLILKVLPREYGLRYPWNFIFKKDLWRKRSSSSKIKFTGKSSESEGNLLGRGIFNPALEAISLDMKQQELDGRYI